MRPIIVQMADKRWTTQAMHLACALACTDEASIVLLRLIQVDHISYLGSAFGFKLLTNSELRDLQDYTATAEDYGVEMKLEQIQCISPTTAVADAADYLDAAVVFARLHQSRIPFLRQFRLWRLMRRLNPERRQLYTLDQPAPDGKSLPTVTIKPAHRHI